MLYRTYLSYFVYSGLPSNISYNWNYGSILGLILGIQIITGIILGMHYVANVELAFYMVEHIMRDIEYGWLIRYLHLNGASLFFLFVYLHMARGLYAGSYVYPRNKLWNVGVVIYILMMGIAFLGYVLPFGQMSLWGATVITNLLSAVPYIGVDLVIFIWGGFSASNPTLNRFYSLHYLLPFVLTALIIIHLIYLHEHASSNPLGISSNLDKVHLHPYFSVKDLYTFLIFFLLLSFLIFYMPNYLNHPDNYIPANPLVTPLSIVPEWFLLVPYAILRTIPDKLFGVIALLLSLLILFILPLQTSFSIRSYSIRSFSKIFYWLLVGSYLILILCGALPITNQIIFLSIFAATYYFSYFLLILPTIHLLDSLLFIKS